MTSAKVHVIAKIQHDNILLLGTIDDIKATKPIYIPKKAGMPISAIGFIQANLSASTISAFPIQLNEKRKYPKPKNHP
jgi:hypothetical protein